MPLQLTTLTNQLMDWANRQDWIGTPGLVQSFIAMAEQKMNSDLRVSQMLQNDTALVTSRCAPLPDDWLEMYLISVMSQVNPNGWAPIRYKSNDEFFNLLDCNAYGYYTIVGRQVYFGGTPDSVNGINYQIVYYGEVPVLNDATDSWVYIKYPTIYLWACLGNAALHAVGEESQAGNFSLRQSGLIVTSYTAVESGERLQSRVTGARTGGFGRGVKAWQIILGRRGCGPRAAQLPPPACRCAPPIPAPPGRAGIKPPAPVYARRGRPVRQRGFEQTVASSKRHSQLYPAATAAWGGNWLLRHLNGGRRRNLPGSGAVATPRL